MTIRLALPLALALLTARAGAAPPDFNRDVAPLLAARCLDCHTGAKAKGGLDLSRRATTLGKNGAVVPGKPGESSLWERVAADEMPPKKPLPEAERKVLKEWIEGGAKWGADPIDPFRVTTAGRAGYDWWSLQPVRWLQPPAVTGAVNDIDRFVRARLAQAGLEPSAPADRRALIRRVAIDLTGLPATPEEVTAFVADPAADAYEKLVDRLLASPHYGERWGRHWLDVVRYGETDGFERNTPRPNAWHYRDWVIRALNRDVPYDEFVRLQLAGDVLRPGDPDAAKAAGFLVAAVHNTVLGNDQMRAVARQDELEDLVGAVGQTFLGLTTHCGRCHDHKYDPISQTDYYRLASALSGVAHGEKQLTAPGWAAETTRLAAEVATLAAALEAIEGPARRAVLAAQGKVAAAGAPPRPIAAWDFRTSLDDQVGALQGRAVGGARQTAAGVVVDGKTGFVRTAPLGADVRERTLEAWARLDALNQRGGGVMSIETPDGAVFDAIVFGEQEPGRWMAGSNGFTRYQSFGGPEEARANQELVHVAITFASDGSIAAYRNGAPYGKAYRSGGPVEYRAGGAVVIFGCRHEPAGGNRMLAGTVAAARLYDRALSGAEVAASYAGGPAHVRDADIDAKLTPAQREERAKLRRKHAAAAEELGRLRARPGEPVYTNVTQPAGVTRFLTRGQVEQPGAVVAPGGVKAVSAAGAEFGLAPDAPEAERRKKLVEWVTSPANPLFARVMVNRVWHYHFGTGIVDTPSDFGFNGGRPSHPELLDWLASEFAAPRGGGPAYSLKRLHRLIVTSATYRQSSAPRPECQSVDADNRLLWRMKPRRLEAEAVRDAMLQAAGLLNREVGGKGFTDYTERNFNGTAYFDPIDPVGPEFHRRSVYRFTPRGGNQGLLDTFDCPDPSSSAPRRGVTTTPLQALALWNGGFALRMAGAFAARVEREAPNDRGAQVTRAWRIAFQRDPTPAERALAERLAAEQGLKSLCRALLNANEFLSIG